MRKNILGFMLLVGVFLVHVSLANATVVFSDNFDSENGGAGTLNYASFANWDVSDGTVDLIGNGYYDFLPGNGLYVDMDGSTGNAGKMTSKQIIPAGTYLFSFDLAGNHRDAELETVNVSFGDYAVGFSLSQNHPFFTVLTLVNVGPGGSAIVFEGTGRDNVGMLLDNVSVSATPLPSAVLLLGSGLVALMGLRRVFLKNNLVPVERVSRPAAG